MAVVFVALALSVSAPAGSDTSSADTGDTFDSSDGSLTYTVLEDGTVSVAANSDGAISGELVIPSTVTDDGNTYTVTQIAASGFAYEHSITSVTIPDTVTYIAERAFYYCNSLTSIVIPDSVTAVGDHAYTYCDAATSLTIGSSVEAIPDGAFASCDSLISIVIPDSVTSVGDGAFYNCSSATSLVIGDSVTYIGYCSFSRCFELASVTFGSSLETIGEEAFSMSYIEYAVFPDSLKTIDENAFSYCGHLKSVVFGSSVETIASGVFQDCYSLTSVALPPSVQNYGDYVFFSNTSLESVSIPNLKSIGEYQFYQCPALTEIFMDEEAYSALSSQMDPNLLESVTRHNYTYEIVFHGNGGRIGGDANAEVYHGIANGFAQTPSRLGYLFAGWNTDPHGEGTAVYAGEEWSLYTDGDDITFDLYAQWDLDYVFLGAVLLGIAISATTVAVTYHYKKEQ
ncbi:MAG: leucine-rich repeat protein [Methanomethylophilus sp.]